MVGTCPYPVRPPLGEFYKITGKVCTFAAQTRLTRGHGRLIACWRPDPGLGDVDEKRCRRTSFLHDRNVRDGAADGRVPTVA